MHSTSLRRPAGALLAAVVGVFGVATVASATPVAQQVNDFESGTTQSWTNGGGAPEPLNVNTGGPAGNDDNFLRVNARGGSGAGSRLATYNRSTQWIGNYTTARLTSVEMDLKNLGTSPLVMRLGLQETGGTRFASALPFNLPADGLWHHATFGLGSSDLTRIGSTSYTTAMTRINELRIIHSTAADFMGDPINSSVGIDNIRAVPEPALLGAAGAAALLLMRRRRR